MDPSPMNIFVEGLYSSQKKVGVGGYFLLEQKEMDKYQQVQMEEVIPSLTPKIKLPPCLFRNAQIVSKASLLSSNKEFLNSTSKPSPCLIIHVIIFKLNT